MNRGVIVICGCPRSTRRRTRSREAGLQKGGLADQVAPIAAQHPDKRVELWFTDEARVGNKGRVCYRWWRRGERPPGVQQLG